MGHESNAQLRRQVKLYTSFGYEIQGEGALKVPTENGADGEVEQVFMINRQLNC